jgi:hypothetical protein
MGGDNVGSCSAETNTIDGGERSWVEQEKDGNVSPLNVNNEPFVDEAG